MGSIRYVLVLLFVAIGCTHNINMANNIGPTARISSPLDLSVGIYIPEEVRELEIADRAEFDKFIFHIGTSIESIIIKSVNRVFSQVSVLDILPSTDIDQTNNIDFVVIPRIVSARVQLSRDEGEFVDDAEGITSLTVELNFYNSEMVQVTNVIASGMGIASETIGFFSRGKEEYSLSVEDALTKLSNDMVRQIYSNYDIQKQAGK